MGNLYQHTHTYENIQREKCFCINFLPISYYDKLVDTINHNDYEAEEFSAGKFTLINAKTIHAPMIQEAFINIECTLKETQDLSGAGITSMIIGQVQHISVEEEYTQGYENRYGKNVFMMLVPAPQDLKTGKPNQSAITTINTEKYD
ncbi:flavin reductase family protein [Enterococcus gallinarum]|uniref:flavin reductase family protein n=1 Tax=Enterococcus gallinarum TaxID=1353 RepID=UPI001F576F60|nr:flavin reductase [Enterococcus gallinarum]MCR1929462.1 flavin reductase [Enterococcus gallinarum]MCR1932879.1 flavin reductase [Enterococcus gallinarum]MCR1945896.1 flavin reductase [Enterococcus gallinarum]